MTHTDDIGAAAVMGVITLETAEIYDSVAAIEKAVYEDLECRKIIFTLNKIGLHIKIEAITPNEDDNATFNFVRILFSGLATYISYITIQKILKDTLYSINFIGNVEYCAVDINWESLENPGYQYKRRLTSPYFEIYI